MTVVGVGLELVDVAGFTGQLDAQGSRVVTAAFTVGELRAAGGTVERLAARWAAKLAAATAWADGAGDRPAGPTPDPAEVEVVVDPEGRPGLVFHGSAAAASEQRYPSGVRVHVSLSHDGGVAAALVVLEAIDPVP